ncbi:MAG: hypothetical protein LBC71_01830 [Oscillospiraceae bacterium]|jgi:hypothetical protein|nr:hypothetical protein [Oscillospiraceae bacterium]
MDGVVRKKRRLPSQNTGASPRKERRDGVRVTSKSTVAPTVVRKQKHTHDSLDALGIELNAGTARQAIILSEIIGKPISKRPRRRY